MTRPKKPAAKARASKPAASKPAKAPKPSKRPVSATKPKKSVPKAPKETLARPLAAESVGGLESPDSSIPQSAPMPPLPAKREGKRARERRLDPDPAVVAQIRELEAQLDRLIDEASRSDLSSLDTDDDDDEIDIEETRHMSSRELEVQETRVSNGGDVEDAPTTHGDGPGFRFDPEVTMPAFSVGSHMRSQQVPLDAPPRVPSPSGPAIPSPPESVFDTARELLSTDFYLRKWGRLAMRGRSEEVDDFGFDPVYDERYRPMLDFLYTKYFRVETTGIENIPLEGRCLLVANHSGTLPLDGVMLKTAVKREHASARAVRWLTEDFLYHMPFLGSTMNRLGAVRACQENAERLLASDELVAVFPEGVKGIGKLFGERYRLQRFGRGGFIKLCLRTSTPIVPVAVLGAEETNPMLMRFEHFSKALGVPYVPVTPTFPLLGPLGLLPAPTKWRILFGEPLDLSAHGPEAADDELLVGKLAERVRASIQGMLDQALSSRKSVFFG